MYITFTLSSLIKHYFYSSNYIVYMIHHKSQFSIIPTYLTRTFQEQLVFVRWCLLCNNRVSCHKLQKRWAVSTLLQESLPLFTSWRGHDKTFSLLTKYTYSASISSKFCWDQFCTATEKIYLRRGASKVVYLHVIRCHWRQDYSSL